jgi:methionyl-tRNA formyltransferase
LSPDSDRLAAKSTRILYLGPPEPWPVLLETPVPRILRQLGAQVTASGEPLSTVPSGIDLAVAYRFRHKVAREVLDSLPIVNLHMAFLPHCRGAHPLFWAVAESAPVGGTVHWMDEGIDTGNVIAQSEAKFSPETTLRQAYSQLQALMLELLRSNWERILAREPGEAQRGPGSFHRADELPELPQGWDTPLSWVREWGLAGR